jgi:dTDP-4-amino-4,6-dideoxygalactose transaminase
MPRRWLGVYVPLSPGAWLRRSPERPPFPLADPRCRLYPLGRHGVWHGMRALGLGPGDEVLSPAYHSGPDIEAMQRVGVTCRFYDAGEGLAPDPAELDELTGPATRCLYLVHYDGFPQDTPRWRRWCDERDLLLVEDAAQSWLAQVDGQPLGSLGDLAFFSVYKMVPIPCGCAAVCRAPLPAVDRSRRMGIGRLGHLHAAWLGRRFGWIEGLRRLRRAPEFDAAAHDDLGDPDAPVAAATAYLLPRISGDWVARRRRSNYRRLLRDLGRHVQKPFDELPDGASPWFFPVETDDKAGLLRQLAARGVSGIDVWSVPHPSLPAEDFPDARRRRSRTVALPVHQELSESDLELIADAAQTSLG